MIKKIALIVYVCCIPVILSCATTLKDESNLAFIFGRIESGDESLNLKYVEFMDCPNTKRSKKYKTDAHKQKGYFWLNNVKFGSYRAITFHQKSLLQTIDGHSGTYYRLPLYGDGPFLVRITKPGIYYMGTYIYKINPKKLTVIELLTGSPETFNLKRVENDNPAEILEWILKNRIRKSSSWYPIFEKTLREGSWINAEETVKL